MKKSSELRTRALQCLARREYSRAELRARLLQYAGEDSGEISNSAQLEELLDDFMARDWLSDERAAAQGLHTRSTRFGVQRIVHELRLKGIADDLISNAITGLAESEQERACQVWQKKYGIPAVDAKEKARQMRFLQSRGFTLEVIVKVLRQEES